jgi:hypothetical protein
MEPIFSPLSKIQNDLEIIASDPEVHVTSRVTPQPRKLSGLGVESVGWVSPANVPITLPNSFHLSVKLEETPAEDREAADALIAMTSPSPRSSFDLILNQKRGQFKLSICTRQEAPSKKPRISSPFSPFYGSPQLSDSHSIFTSPVPSSSSISFDDFDSNSLDSLSFVTPLKTATFTSPSIAACPGGSGVTLDILADMAADQLTFNTKSSQTNDTTAASDHNLSRIVIHTLTNLRGEPLADQK